MEKGRSKEERGEERMEMGRHHPIFIAILRIVQANKSNKKKRKRKRKITATASRSRHLLFSILLSLSLFLSLSPLYKTTNLMRWKDKNRKKEVKRERRTMIFLVKDIPPSLSY